jgi:hypothetical protein
MGQVLSLLKHDQTVNRALILEYQERTQEGIQHGAEVVQRVFFVKNQFLPVTPRVSELTFEDSYQEK